MRRLAGDSVLGRYWIVVVVALVLVTAGTLLGALRLRHAPDRAIGHSLPAVPVAASPVKSVLYQLDGDQGAAATVSYLVPGGATRDERVVLPWKYTLDVTDLTASVGVLAQSESGRVRCRISVDGEVRHAAVAETDSAVANCAVPAI
ncbi:MmpS family transport accessory protein [Actinomycetes bacterium M1A6_2h]